MGKKLLFFTIILLLFIDGCHQSSIVYSEKFEGIPLYPNLEIIDNTEHIEKYKDESFDGYFEEVKNFYINNINQEQWTIKENPLYDNRILKNSGIIKSSGVQGFLLINDEREVSLLLEYWETKEGESTLHVTINGSPLKEKQYHVIGESDHWKAFIDYTITKDFIWADGYIMYTGINPPKILEYEFMLYEIIENKNIEARVIHRGGSQSQKNNSKYYILNMRHQRKHSLEKIKNAIDDTGYIGVNWIEQEKELTEKLFFSIST